MCISNERAEIESQIAELNTICATLGAKMHDAWREDDDALADELDALVDIFIMDIVELKLRLTNL